MRTCYFHVGMPKTGSTSIQKIFRTYSDERLEYAQMTHSNHGGLVSLKYASTPKSLRLYKNRDISAKDLQACVDDAVAQVEKALAGEKDIILSGETIIRQLPPKDIKAMYADLRTRFDRIVTIAYVRPVAGSVVSQTQQVLRMGSRNLSLPSPRFEPFFKPLIRNSKLGELMIRRFDKADLVNGDIVQDFASLTGAVIENAPDQERRNESLSTEALGTFLSYNKYVAPHLPFRQARIMRGYLYKALQGAGSIKFGLEEDLVAAHLKEYEQDISWMEEKTGFDLRGNIKSVSEPVGSTEQLLSLALPFPEPDAQVADIYKNAAKIVRRKAPGSLSDQMMSSLGG